MLADRWIPPAIRFLLKLPLSAVTFVSRFTCAFSYLYSRSEISFLSVNLYFFCHSLKTLLQTYLPDRFLSQILHLIKRVSNVVWWLECQAAPDSLQGRGVMRMDIVFIFSCLFSSHFFSFFEDTASGWCLNLEEHTTSINNWLPSLLSVLFSMSIKLNKKENHSVWLAVKKSMHILCCQQGIK